jgi:hypothetical protein
VATRHRPLIWCDFVSHSLHAILAPFRPVIRAGMPPVGEAPRPKRGCLPALLPRRGPRHHWKLARGRATSAQSRWPTLPPADPGRGPTRRRRATRPCPGCPGLHGQGRGGLSGPPTASDVSSLGVVLYELLAGRPPFAAPTLQGLLRQIFFHAPKLLSVYRPGLSSGLDAVCLKALAKSPTERYPGVADLLAALDTAPAALASTAEADLPVACPDCGTRLPTGRSGQRAPCPRRQGTPRAKPTHPPAETSRRRWRLAVLAFGLPAGGLLLDLVSFAGLVCDHRLHDAGG